ncbi:MAG: hypothetical protein WAN74_05230 [Thermoplasmata archaeon]
MVISSPSSERPSVMAASERRQGDWERYTRAIGSPRRSTRMRRLRKLLRHLMGPERRYARLPATAPDGEPKGGLSGMRPIVSFVTLR